MKRFRFKSDLLLNADGAESLLQEISGHLADMCRHAGNGRSLADLCKHFSIEEVSVDWEKEAAARKAASEAGQVFDDGTNDLDDHIVADSGPIALTLDPESAAGKSLAEQQAREASERERMQQARANEGRSDAEIMADFSKREQANLASK